MIRNLTLISCLAALLLGLAGCGGGSERELTESGKALMAKKDTKGAVIQFKNALQKNPQSAEVRLLLGRALLESGDPVLALVELRKAQELQTPDEQVIPDLARAMLLLGEEAKVIVQFAGLKLTDNNAIADLQTTVAAAHVMQGETEKARAAALVALQAKPMYPPAVILQARLKASDGDFDGALLLLDEILAKEPAHERAGVLKGEILAQGKKDNEAALAALRKVLAANPDSLAAHTATITLLYEQRKPTEAKAQFQLLKKVAPNHPDTLFFEAQIAFTDKDYKTAREISAGLLKMMPENVRVLELAGATEYRLKQYLQAEAFLGHALKNVPGLLVSRRLLAQTFLRSNQPSKAIEVLQPVLDSKQPDGTSLALAGEAWLQMGDAKKSEAAFQQAAKAAPKDANVRTSVAMAQISRGNSGIAVAELETIAAEDKGPRADLALISARLRQNDTAGALKAIDGLERKMPDRPLAYNLRGRVQLLKQDVPAATKSFETALTKDPNYFPAVASLAAIDLTAGKPDAARKRFEDLLKVQPKSFQAMLALAELSARVGAPPEEVVRILKDAAKLNPSEPTPHLMLIGHLLTSGDAKGALVAAQDATAALPNDLIIMDALGRAQIAAGNGQQAVSTFTKLASLQPTQAMHQVRLADAYAANKDRENAGRALKRALEIEPGLETAQRAQVALALMDQRPQDGLVLAREMQKKTPKEAVGYALEGDVEASRKNWDAAASAYRAALQRGSSAEIAVKLHNALRTAGKRADADRMAADWRKANQKDPAFLYYLGDVALSQNDLAGAEADYRAVLELQPRNALALNNVAWLMVKQGKAGALPMAEKAAALLPDRAPILDTLATVLAAEGQLVRAVEVQKRAVVRNPQDANLKLNLARYLVKSGEKAQARTELESLAKLGDKFKAQAEVAALLKSL
jgi:putative PEP-CTERM system TPR-repeat lipoprotein